MKAIKSDSDSDSDQPKKGRQVCPGVTHPSDATVYAGRVRWVSEHLLS